ncbi:hypothetical protein GQ55_2G335000 [Panicum hallii var. hallii]|uniref:Uncharacterized protein n=1 Tax=Panicum hallii var. hallii TaxID=1504633 RepID=A0A2T7EV53_9POAL|nr:hypothetical protein GQ55_2G335000 [Panicum hallii var. hallii]
MHPLCPSLKGLQLTCSNFIPTPDIGPQDCQPMYKSLIYLRLSDKIEGNGTIDLPLSQSIAKDQNKCVSLSIPSRQRSTYQLLGVWIMTSDLGSCFLGDQTFASTENLKCHQAPIYPPILQANRIPILFNNHWDAGQDGINF